jgi:hypothetical protein
MRIAFYAPLKPPDHPVPSGDRHIARLLMTALRLAGHEVTIASRLRSRDGTGDAARQARLAALGARLATRYLRRTDPPPELWFTYHLYDRAPDHLGPPIAQALGIPYIAAEASLAPRRAGGAWAAGHASVVAALRQAAAVIGLNPADAAGVVTALPDVRRYHALPPFLDLRRFAAPADRAAVAAAFDLDPGQPWLVALAMMRPGAKLASYQALAASSARAISPMRCKWPTPSRCWTWIRIRIAPPAESCRAAGPHRRAHAGPRRAPARPYPFPAAGPDHRAEQRRGRSTPRHRPAGPTGP